MQVKYGERTALHVAAGLGDSKLMNLLLTYVPYVPCALLDVVDKEGNTPLEIACVEQHVVIVRQLLAAGSTPTISSTVLTAKVSL